MDAKKTFVAVKNLARIFRASFNLPKMAGQRRSISTTLPPADA
jgi:hypothetical protein